MTNKQRIGLLTILISLSLIVMTLALSENWGTEGSLYLVIVPYIWEGNTNFITRIFIPFSGEVIFTKHVIGPLVVPLFIGIIIFLDVLPPFRKTEQPRQSDEERDA